MNTFNAKSSTLLMGSYQPQLLLKIVETNPQSAYSIFVGGSYFICTILEVSELLLPVWQKFFPAITGGQTKEYFCLLTYFGRLNIPHESKLKLK